MSRTLPPPPPGTVWVEWVGEPSPLDDDFIRLGIAAGRFTPDQVEVLRALSKRRIGPVDGVARRILRGGNGYGEIPRLCQAWTWGPSMKAAPGLPGATIQALPFGDADAVKGSDSGHEFTVHGEQDGAAVPAIALPTGRVILAEPEQFRDFAGFRRAMGG